MSIFCLLVELVPLFEQVSEWHLAAWSGAALIASTSLRVGDGADHGDAGNVSVIAAKLCESKVSDCGHHVDLHAETPGWAVYRGCEP